MAGLDLRLFQKHGGLYAPPLCTELTDILNFTYNDGTTEALYVDGSAYECSKLGDSLYLASGRGAAFAIDTEGGAVVCVAVGGGSPIVSLGVLSEGGKNPALTSELDGNTLTWRYGPGSADVVTAVYADGGASLTAARELSAPEFSAVALGDGVYLQCAVVCGYDEPLTVALLSDFTRNLFVGAVLGREPQRFAGYATQD